MVSPTISLLLSKPRAKSAANNNHGTVEKPMLFLQQGNPRRRLNLGLRSLKLPLTWANPVLFQSRPSGNSIRLLRLSTGVECDPLHGTLKVHDLKDFPDYEAL